MHEVMRFWLRKGVNGFRVDVIWHLIKFTLQPSTNRSRWPVIALRPGLTARS